LKLKKTIRYAKLLALGIKIFLLGASSGRSAPNVILGPLISRKVLELKKFKLKTQLDIVKYSPCV